MRHVINNCEIIDNEDLQLVLQDHLDNDMQWLELHFMDNNNVRKIIMYNIRHPQFTIEWIKGDMT